MAVLFALSDRLADAAPEGPVLRAGDAVGRGDHAAADADLLGETGGEEGLYGIRAADQLAARLLLLRARDARRDHARCWCARALALGPDPARDPRRRGDLPGGRHQRDLLQDRLARDQRRLRRRSAARSTPTTSCRWARSCSRWSPRSPSSPWSTSAAWRASTAPVGGAILLTLLTELLRNFGEWRLLIYSLRADPDPVLPARRPDRADVAARCARVGRRA